MKKKNGSESFDQTIPQLVFQSEIGIEIEDAFFAKVHQLVICNLSRDQFFRRKFVFANTARCGRDIIRMHGLSPQKFIAGPRSEDHEYEKNNGKNCNDHKNINL